MQTEHILHVLHTLIVTKHFFQYVEMNNYNQQDILFFLDTAKYKISKAKENEEKERNVWQSNTVRCKTLLYDVLA
jgi:hypothetical protein